jgi:hypothetical protein
MYVCVCVHTRTHTSALHKHMEIMHVSKTDEHARICVYVYINVQACVCATHAREIMHVRKADEHR